MHQPGFIPAAAAPSRWAQGDRHFGEIHPKVLAAFDIKLPVSGFEIVLDALPEPKTKSRAPFAPSPFQAIERDFAFVVDQSVAAGI